MIIYVDIDNTICKSCDNSLDYSKSIPYPDRIDKINKLYDSGNTIIYWTARGTLTGIDWSQLTLKQFTEWNVKFHELKFKKPYYDLFIDDKNINSETYFKK